MTAVLHCGDALDVLQTLPAKSVRCCVTSPPYWGLRDYGTATWEGGGAGCDHREVQAQNRDGRETPGGRGGSFPTTERAYKHICAKCGARRIDNQLGLEPTPDEYVANMVAVFREVRRVLTDDGTLWLNLGDSYQNAKGQAGGVDPKQPARRHGLRPQDRHIAGLKPKDLVGIPWRVAFALQADGWWLRSDIIWAKPNPMTESVTDRPTKAHEYVFLLSKSARYYYDANAISEPITDSSVERLSQPRLEQQVGSDRVPGKTNGRMKAVYKQDGHGRRHGRRHAGFNARWEASDGPGRPSRNARTVWTIATKPYPEAHFATFPPELPSRCIKAGSASGDTVLDPFGGSGVTPMVATGLGRNAIYIDLNPEYIEMARQRIGPLLCTEAVA